VTERLWRIAFWGERVGMSLARRQKPVPFGEGWAGPASLAGFARTDANELHEGQGA
jgi:hypothetical protein